MSNFAIGMDMRGGIAGADDERETVARIISLAKGAPEKGQTSVGAWWWDKRHDRARPEHFEGECRDEDCKHADLMIPLLRSALTQPEPTAEQAAGEAEAVAYWLYEKQGCEQILLRQRDTSWCAVGFSETPLYATPQPTAGEAEPFASEPIGQIRVETNGEWILKGWATNLPEGIHWIYAAPVSPTPVEAGALQAIRDIVGKIPISEFPGKSYRQKQDNAEKVCDTLAALSQPGSSESGGWTWEMCRIGSCMRHGRCMYHPCRSSTPSSKER